MERSTLTCAHFAGHVRTLAITYSLNAMSERAMIEWFDDMVLFMRFKSPEKRVTREDIKVFASEFDPQAFHLDEAAAERSVFKGPRGFRLAHRGDRHAAVGRDASIRPPPLARARRGRTTMARPGAPGRCPPSGRRVCRAHAVTVETARDRQGQMDRVQSAR